VDRGRPILIKNGLRLLAVALVVALNACAAAPESVNSETLKASDIRALRWLAPGADSVKALTTKPAACRNVVEVFILAPSDSDMSRQELGRLAFESPALLGGAAGRMGLSCSSCHLNGRGNPDFFLAGMSDTPGTADVTSGFFSKVRGDQTFNPVPIPDLAARYGKQIRNRKSREFSDKVHGLVVEEFDGQETPAYVYGALLAYMDSLDIAGCATRDARVPVSAEFDWMDASGAFLQAAWLAGEGRRDDALLLGRVARERLERLHERFVMPDQAAVRAAIVGASRAIEAWMAVSDANAASARAVLDRTRSLVVKNESRSLYNPDLLRAALGE
jgi:hypothetical protein